MADGITIPMLVALALSAQAPVAVDSTVTPLSPPRPALFEAESQTAVATRSGAMKFILGGAALGAVVGGLLGSQVSNGPAACAADVGSCGERSNKAFEGALVGAVVGSTIGLLQGHHPPN